MRKFREKNSAKISRKNNAKSSRKIMQKIGEKNNFHISRKYFSFFAKFSHFAKFRFVSASFIFEKKCEISRKVSHFSCVSFARNLKLLKYVINMKTFI